MSIQKPQTERGHEEPFIRQFSIFLPNRVGQLSELLGLLEAAGIEVAGVSVVDSTDWAVVRMVFLDPDKVREVLKGHRIAFTECDALGVVLEDPSTLQQACKALVAAELNVQFAYPLLIQRDGRPIMLLHVDDEVVAVQVLTRHRLRLLGHEDEEE